MGVQATTCPVLQVALGPVDVTLLAARLEPRAVGRPRRALARPGEPDAYDAALTELERLEAENGERSHTLGPGCAAEEHPPDQDHQAEEDTAKHPEHSPRGNDDRDDHPAKPLQGDSNHAGP